MSWRQDKRTPQERGYSYRWRKARAAFLRAHPLCVYCQHQGIVEPATVVDHIKPHRGDVTLFWDTSNWQPLCKAHHDATKSRQEHGRTVHIHGADGWPIE